MNRAFMVMLGLAVVLLVVIVVQLTAMLGAVSDLEARTRACFRWQTAVLAEQLPSDPFNASLLSLGCEGG